jgi:hypothetical protein
MPAPTATRAETQSISMTGEPKATPQNIWGDGELQPSGPETYRFSWSSVFAQPIQVRVVRQPDSIQLRWKAWDEPSRRNRVPKLATEGARGISESEWSTFLLALDKADFWSLLPGEAHGGNDGETWTLEGVRAGEYQRVAYWNPRDSFGGKEVADACLVLLRLTPFDMPEQTDHRAQ